MNPFKIWDIVELVEGYVSYPHVLFKKKMKIVAIIWDDCIIDTWGTAFWTLQLHNSIFVHCGSNENFYLNLMSE